VHKRIVTVEFIPIYGVKNDAKWGLKMVTFGMMVLMMLIMIKYDNLWGLNLDTFAPKWSKFMYFCPDPPFLSVSKDPETPSNQLFHTPKRLRDREIYIETRVAYDKIL
jgi:hypothetical protein